MDTDVKIDIEEVTEEASDEQSAPSLATELSSATQNDNETAQNPQQQQQQNQSNVESYPGEVQMKSNSASDETDSNQAIKHGQEDVYEGTIKTLKHDKCFGFVHAPLSKLPEGFTRSDIYFKWFEDNATEFLGVKPGLKVQFILDDKCEKDKPSMKELNVVDGDSIRRLPIAHFGKRRNRSSQSLANTDIKPLLAMEYSKTRKTYPSPGNKPPLNQRTGIRLTGVILEIKERDDNNSIGFIKPIGNLPEGYIEQGDVRFFLRDVRPLGLVPRCEDEVSFVLGSRDKSKPHAVRVYIESYGSTRSELEIEKILRDMFAKVQNISANPSSDGLIELLSGVEIWKCVTNFCPLNNSNIEILIKLLFELKSVSQGLHGNFKTLLRAILGTHMFHPTEGSFVQYVQSLVLMNDQENLISVRNFLVLLAESVPEKINVVSSIVRHMVSVDKDSVEYFVYSILKIATSQNKSDSSFEDKEWKELSLAPTSHEILHGPLEGAFNLRPVNENSSYSSAEEYLDIYFRLFRADCFSALNKGVRDLLNDRLDHRDMNAYHSVELFGIDVSTQNMPVIIGIKLTPFHPVRKWDKSRKLMFGNLICISVAGNFRDAIWATVVSRDLLQQKSVVMLELCSECNSMEDSEVIHYLQTTDKRSVLVESPTYYRAYQPILKNLQRMDPETIPFQDAIVKTLKGVSRPQFVQEDTKIKVSDTKEIIFEDYLQAKNQIGIKFTFDESQEIAYKNCLNSQIAIIQGPPGTGKTYVGLKLVKTLNDLSTKPDSPILLLTYKNHALDEFLKQLAATYPESIARIGGRQQDAEMAKYNLSEMKRETRKSKDLFSKIMDHRDDMDRISKSLGKGFEATCRVRWFNFDMFFANATPDQLEQLLLSCPWTHVFIPSVLMTSGFASGNEFTAVTKRKRGRGGPLVDKNEIGEIIRLIKTVSKDIKQFYVGEFETNDVSFTQLQTGLKGLFFEAFKMWLPSRNVFALVKDTLNHSAFVDYTKFGTTESKEKKEEEEDSDDEAKDEEEERKAATDDMKGVKVKLENILRIDKNHYAGQWPEKFAIPKEYLSDLFVTQLTRHDNLWDLSDRDRVMYAQITMHKQFEEVSTRFVEDLTRYKAAHQCKKELDNLHSLSILRQKKFVGMTITGASIHCDLVAQLRPEIVVVEEAAEVMEPQLLSCLGPWVQHLILIGDHKQLRPNVESYELRRNYHLDLSLMERLINNGLEYSTLQLQNRMRPEFAEMLKDIYPHLKSNLARVEKNQVHPSVAHSMYFWCHRFQECGPDSKQKGKTKTEAGQGRSYTNEEEVDRCINLALFFIRQGCKPETITIIGAYLGQVKLLRKKMRDARSKYMDLFPGKGDGDEDTYQRDGATIQTIDNYQGDENDIVIVSLVRSNNRNNIGFLNTINRRCVAQSRAKCGMYFVGNEVTIGSSKHWGDPIINHMKELDLVGPRIPLRCKNHATSTVNPANAEEVPLKNFCPEQCGILQPCKKHKCKLQCQPYHEHNRCLEKVHFIFEKCGHLASRKCYQDESKQVCRERVAFKYSKCDHIGEKYCPENAELMVCDTIVTFQHSCSHYATRKCSDDQSKIICEQKVTFKYPCGHTGTKKCHEEENNLQCTEDVYVALKCGHVGSKKCREDSSTIICKAKIHFNFKKCGHSGNKMCFQTEEDVKCTHLCLKPYASCGHLCEDKCSQPCVQDRCKECARIRKAEEKKAKEAEKERLEAIRKNVDSEISDIMSKPVAGALRRELSITDDPVEYLDVHDKVMRYIQPMHLWRPQITKIEKITNAKLHIEFLKYKKEMVNPSITQDKFHGTHAKATDKICQEGFKIPESKGQMFGAGIYFATDSSKSAQETYTKGSGMLLLCEVLLGKSFVVTKSRKDMTAKKLRSLGYDSVTAPRGTAVKNDEFIVYNPEQALPKYVIHYEKVDVDIKVPGSVTSDPRSPTIQKHTIVSKRTSSLDDPLEMHFRIVESQFLRLKGKYPSRVIPDIKSIDYHINPALVANYKAKKNLFKKQFGARQESEEVLAFHGTRSENIESIINKNFDMNMIRRTAHGKGIYFSEFPEISEGYGNALLLCRVLPGKAHIETEALREIPSGYDSIAVQPDTEGRAQMIIIADPDQILPCYVVNT